MKKPNKTSYSNINGFTLVELLVVIFIIAILSTVGFVGMRRMTENAHRTNTMGNMKQLTSAGQLFSQENDAKIVTHNLTNLGYGELTWAEHLLITLNPELLGTSEGTPVYNRVNGDAVAREIGIFGDQKLIKQHRASMGASGVNSWRTYSYSSQIGDIPGLPVFAPTFSHQVELPHRLRLITQKQFATPAFPVGDDGRTMATTDFETYSKKSPVAFYDGHVEFYTQANYPATGGRSPATGTPYTEDELNEFTYGRREN